MFFGTPENYEGPKTNFEISEIVSDSILLVSHDVDDVASTNNFIGAIHLFLELGLANGFMFRGGVNQGDIIFDEVRKIFLSKEFNELAKFEPKINAPVCVIFEKAKPIIFSSLFGFKLQEIGVVPSRVLPIVKWSVPLKDEVAELWCINYTFFCSGEQVTAAIEYLAGDLAKQENFISYLGFLGALPETALSLGENRTVGTFVRVMKSRSGMRVFFVNESGSIVGGPIQWGFPSVFIEPPEDVTIHVDSESNQVGFKVVGRWAD